MRPTGMRPSKSRAKYHTTVIDGDGRIMWSGLAEYQGGQTSFEFTVEFTPKAPLFVQTSLPGLGIYRSIPMPIEPGEYPEGENIRFNWGVSLHQSSGSYDYRDDRMEGEE